MLPDYLAPNLIAVFVGTSVSTISADQGHYYSHPTNRFWELLVATGLLGDGYLEPKDDVRLNDHGLGLTDVVKVRAAASDARLRPEDFDVSALVRKVEVFRPRSIGFNSKRAVEVIARSFGEAVPAIGPATWSIAGASVYRLPSSSATAAIGMDVKREAWTELGSWARRLP